MYRTSSDRNNKKPYAIFMLSVIFAFAMLFSLCSAAAATEVVYTSDDLTPGSVVKTMPVTVCIEPTAGVDISPDHTGEGSPGETLNLAHTITNKGNIFDTFDISYTSSNGWTYKFFTDPNGDGNPSDGVELTDTDGDGKIDTGEIDHCGKIIILKVVTIPPTAVVGTSDTMVMTVTSSLYPTVKDQATNTVHCIPPLQVLGGVLPFTGAVLLPLLICGGMLIGAGASISRRYRILIVPR